MTTGLETNKFNPQFIENEALRHRLEYLEGLISAGEHFESTRSLVDLKSFLKDVKPIIYLKLKFLGLW
jgi:hypothetical protein